MRRTPFKFPAYFLLALLAWWFHACSEEEYITQSGPSGRFFNASGASKHLQDISFLLKQKNDSSEFVSRFVEAYGYPLWKNAVDFSEDDKLVFAVPVRNKNSNREIEAIWFFSIGTSRTTYNIYTRGMADRITSRVGDEIEQTWMFDYFTRKALRKEPSSRLDFAPITSAPSTRGWETRCVSASVEVGGYSDDKGTHCWMVFLPNSFSEEGNNGEGDGFRDGDLGYGGHSWDDGEGGGGNSNDDPPSTPLAKKIITNMDGLNREQKEKLEKAIEEMKEKMCYAEAIYNYLSNGNTKYDSVRIDPALGGGMGSAANVYLNDGRVNLVFRDGESINYDSFSHELVHLLQKSLGLYTNQNGRGMMEYERVLMDDILFFARHKGDRKNISDDDWRDKPNILIYGNESPEKETEERKKWEKEKEDYEEWVKDLTKNGVPASISADDFKKWTPLFYNNNRSYSPDRGYKYDTSYTPKALRKALELAKANCQQ